MSTSFLQPIADTALPAGTLPPFPVHRFSVEQYFELSRLGLLGEGDNCELLQGWIVTKMVKNPRHDNTVDILLGLLTAMIPPGWFLRVQNLLQTALSAPEPDFAIVRGQRGSFPNRHPQGSDVGLVIEVADSSLAVDRRKADIYATAGVPNYWIVNLPERCLEIYELPQPRGTAVSYAPPRILRGQEEAELILDAQAVGTISCELMLPERGER